MKNQPTYQPKFSGQLNSFSSLFYFIVLLMLVILALSYDALAFRGDSARDPEQIIAELSEKLQLTDVQAEQIRSIIEDQGEKRKEIFEKYSSQGREGRRGLRKDMKALRNVTDSQIMNLLTEEQIVKYQAMQEERYQQMQERRGRSGKRGGGRFN